ncbi:DEAD/DEAH box helicase [Malikia spinosa]|nr:DEAD/DEAH box helicase [Malikia spinosa]
MASKHNATHRLLAIGLFDGLNAFSELETRLSALPTNKERGDAFEIFAEAYFATQKIALARDVWPFEAIPLVQRRSLSLDTGRDMGVDGLYETTDGELRAYQVKFRSRRPALTWDELSTFMGLTDQVSQRVLFTNCDTLPSLMQDRSGFVAIRGSDLDRLTAEDFNAMHEWLHSGRVELPRKQPRPHQDEALANIATGLVTNDRATVVMACGTGKSLVALWAAERHAGKTLLVLVPSLALVRQLLHEWLRETTRERFSFMCVCSDPTVAKGADDLVVHQADLDFPVTTDSAVVRQYLEKPFDGTRFVFSTYQSAQVVAEGMPVDADGQRRPFDLGIFDEAHKTASRDGTRFSFALEDANLPITKRLFFTATPRHYDVRKKDKEGDSTLVYSMDRPEVYGPVVHTLSFAEAARRGIICDYKVVVSVVTSDMVDDYLLRHGETIVAGDTVKARQVALQVALQKAVEKYGVSRIFTFHGSVKAAKSFTSTDSEGIGQHLSDFATLHVSGEMPTARREEQMKAFREAGKAVMSNARCLTEGVDVPAVDMVAFITPRKSKVDIVQATGRAMRRAPGKEIGYVMVPLFVEQAANESIEDALKRTGFDDLWDLLGAMKEQDDVLVDIIRQMQEDKGRTGVYDDCRFSERVEVLGPSVSLETIRKSITAECLESLGVSWNESIGRLLAFVEREGHCLVPKRYLSSDGYKLGIWVIRQRVIKEGMPSGRRKILEAIPGWVWDVLDNQWEEAFRCLDEFVERNGSCQVPVGYVAEGDIRLHLWIKTQRTLKNKLTTERRARLESLLGWTWDALSAQWEKAFEYLEEFASREGHCRVPQKYKTIDGYRLGQWVTNIRASKFKLDDARKERLEALPGWTWGAFSAQWEIGFLHLVEFLNSGGTCHVSSEYRSDDGYRLGAWIASQRGYRSSLSVDRIKRLESIPGWSWDVLSDRWEVGFSHLKNFVDRECNCLVKGGYQTDDGFHLGNWVQAQRSRKEKMTAKRKEKLEAIHGWSWSVRADFWEAGFSYLKEFSECEGHTRVPSKYKTSDGYRLGLWVARQRAAKDTLSVESRSQLEALPGWGWDLVKES